MKVKRGDPQYNALIQTGTYTGDGSLAQAVTGIGFTPKIVMVWRHFAAGNELTWTIIDQMGANLCFLHYGADTHHIGIADRVTSIDNDGFTVDDGGADADPNKNAAVYDYVAIGW